MEDCKSEVVISNVNGNPDVVTFILTVSKILQDFKTKNENESVEVEKMKIIKAAADIIRNDIKQMASNLQSYPTVSDIEHSLNFVPTTMSYFLDNLITCKTCTLVRSSIAQSIMQNVRPRSIMAPVQLSLAVLLHRHFGSRYLIDTLHKLGFCSSYLEVLQFESCAAQQHGIELHDTVEPP